MKTVLPFAPPYGRKTGAFSLVEVAMAIGILSFCMISIMGLIPVALQTSRQSMSKSTEIRMLQAARAALLNTPYSALATDGYFSFDADGFLISGPGEERYRVFYVNSPFTVLPGDGQNAGRLTTTRLSFSNTVTGEVRTNSLHLPDNGF